MKILSILFFTFLTVSAIHAQDWQLPLTTPPNIESVLDQDSSTDFIEITSPVISERPVIRDAVSDAADRVCNRADQLRRFTRVVVDRNVQRVQYITDRARNLTQKVAYRVKDAASFVRDRAQYRTNRFRSRFGR